MQGYPNLLTQNGVRDLLAGRLGSDLVSGDGGDDALFGTGNAIYGSAGNDLDNNIQGDDGTTSCRVAVRDWIFCQNGAGLTYTLLTMPV